MFFGLFGGREERDKSGLEREEERYMNDPARVLFGDTMGYSYCGTGIPRSCGTCYPTFSPSSIPARREGKRDQRCPYCGMKPDRCGCGYS